MITAKRLLLATFLGAVLCTSCAVSPEVEERRRAIDEDIEAILSESLDAGQAGEPKRCLADREYRDFRALDDRHIIFEGLRGQLWLNTLRMRCPDLRHGTVLRVRSYSTMGRICDADTFQVGDWFDWPWYRRWPWRWTSSWGTGIACSLGKFHPVTEEQVAEIEAVLRAN